MQIARGHARCSRGTYRHMCALVQEHLHAPGREGDEGVFSLHFIVQSSLLWCTAALVGSSRVSSHSCPRLLFLFNNFYFQCHLCRHMEALIASLSACDSTFDPGWPQCSHGDTEGTGQIQALSKSDSSSATVSTLPPLLRSDRQPHALLFILLTAVFYFVCHSFWLWSDRTSQRMFRNSSLMQDRLV